MREAVSWFGPAIEQDDVQTRVLSKCDDPHWALHNEKVSSWLDIDQKESVLWLTEKPGVGTFSILCFLRTIY